MSEPLTPGTVVWDAVWAALAVRARGPGLLLADAGNHATRDAAIRALTSEHVSKADELDRG